jgi:hypothetical protein
MNGGGGGSLHLNHRIGGASHYRQLKSAKNTYANDRFHSPGSATVYLQNGGLSNNSQDEKLRSNKVLQFINVEACSE